MPAAPGVAVTVAVAPAQTVGLFTVTVGIGLTVTIPEALALTHNVVVFVRITLYVPAIVVEKLATFPGAVAPAGTVHAYEYIPATPGVAVTVAEAPAQTVGLFTVAVGNGLIVTVPEALALTQVVVVFVSTTL